MKRILFFSILIVSVIALTLNSCKKEEGPDTETQSVVDNAICEGEFTKIMPTVNNYGIKEQGVKSLFDRSGCPSVTIDPTDTLNGFPVTMVIDYGTAGCAAGSVDGKVRKGMIQSTFYSSWDSIGAKVVVKLIDYYVNDVKYVVDSITITRSALYAFTVDIKGGKCTSPSWALEWASNRTLTQVGGTGDLDPQNDVFSLTGTADGKNRNGKKYTNNIVVPLIKKSSCSWIETGKFELTPEGLNSRTVDFGNGLCDPKATVTIGGNTFQINMN